MTSKPVAHGSFTIERVYPASPARVFAAWSDIEIKSRWFIGPPGWTQIKRETNFVPGGSEILHGRFPGNGPETLYTARFHHIADERRIVYVYDMFVNGKHHSLSLSTLEIDPVKDGTRLRYTEQIAYLDGTDGITGTASREHGVGTHFDGLGRLLQE